MVLSIGMAAALASLAGCARNWLAEREVWRHEAEINCLKSGAIKESAALVRIDPIQGPGVCGADFPLKVAALGESNAIGFTDDIRPPGGIPGAGNPAQPQWPISPQRSAPSPYDRATPNIATNSRITVAPLGEPLSIRPPERGVAAPTERPFARPMPVVSLKRPSVFDAPAPLADEDSGEDDSASRAPVQTVPAAHNGLPKPYAIPLGKNPSMTGAIGPVEVKPAATLACPIVSALDRWITDAVQPAAQRWFGQQVVEIKQISAYSCRGMNGNSHAHISEHAFGNALDIAAFTLADGRKVTVKNGWRGAPEEQGFLHDVQGAACQQFTTVLAPGSNVYHYDHIHVDLMRRSSGRIICQPAAIPGEVVAARAVQGRGYAKRGEPAFTGSIGSTRKQAGKKPINLDDEDEMENLDEERPHGGPGDD